MRLWLGCVVMAGCALLAVVGLAGAASAAGGSGPVFGVADDAPLFALDSGAKSYAELKNLGMSQERFTVLYEGDPTSIATAPFLDGALAAAKTAGVEPTLSLFADPNGPSGARAPAAGPFCRWVRMVAARYPDVTRFIIGNEVNTTRFWSPQHTRADANAGPDRYEALLARCYDTLKALNPAIQVVGMGLSPRSVDAKSTAPLAFIRAVGAAYKASHRSAPIMDQLAVHPYPNPNANPPPLAFDAGYEKPDFYGITQLGRVKQAVYDAFRHTGQPTTLTGLRLLVDEIGYQTPESGKPLYTGIESSPTVSESTQARNYAYVVQDYACDPSLAAVLFLHLRDEANLDITPTSGGWQSGLEHPDGSRKPAYGVVRKAIAAGCVGSPVKWAPVRGVLVGAIGRIRFTSGQTPREVGVELAFSTALTGRITLVRGSKTLSTTRLECVPAGAHTFGLVVPAATAAGPAVVNVVATDDLGRPLKLSADVDVPAAATTTGKATTTTPPAASTRAQPAGGVVHT